MIPRFTKLFPFIFISVLAVNRPLFSTVFVAFIATLFPDSTPKLSKFLISSFKAFKLFSMSSKYFRVSFRAFFFSGFVSLSILFFNSWIVFLTLLIFSSDY